MAQAAESSQKVAFFTPRGAQGFVAREHGGIPLEPLERQKLTGKPPTAKLITSRRGVCHEQQPFNWKRARGVAPQVEILAGYQPGQSDHAADVCSFDLRADRDLVRPARLKDRGRALS